MLWHLNASSLSVLAALSSVLEVCLIDLVVHALTNAPTRYSSRASVRLIGSGRCLMVLVRSSTMGAQTRNPMGVVLK